jgi:hypothetical protein
MRPPPAFKSRRSFLGNVIRLTFLSGIMPLVYSCNSEQSEKKPQGKGSGNAPAAKKRKQKWSYESLVLNKQTQVLHIPSRQLYTYYDEIRASHLVPMSLTALTTTLEDQTARLNIGQSGKIAEVLCLYPLRQVVNDETLSAAADHLSIAFRDDYSKVNQKNFRLHELMLQLIALKTSIPENEKWQVFNSRTRKPTQLKKRQNWMSSETNFIERVRYITARTDEYKERLKVRAAKYSFA